ncbi:hypothetical protein IMG5_144720, partial [Ichthyophthirius multifiliis]
DKTSSIFIGLNQQNELVIFNILKHILKKADTFKNNKLQSSIIKSLYQYVQFAQKLELEITENINKKIDEKNGLSNKKKRAFCNLIIAVCIQTLFNNNDEGLENLEELSQVYQEIINYYNQKQTQEKPKKKRKIINQDGEEVIQENQHYIHVLSDLLVSLLTKSSSIYQIYTFFQKKQQDYFREITNICFQAFVNEVDTFVLQTLIDVVTRPIEEYIQDMENDKEGDEEECQLNDQIQGLQKGVAIDLIDEDEEKEEDEETETQEFEELDN